MVRHAMSTPTRRSCAERELAPAFFWTRFRLAVALAMAAAHGALVLELRASDLLLLDTANPSFAWRFDGTSGAKMSGGAGYENEGMSSMTRTPQNEVFMVGDILGA